MPILCLLYSTRSGTDVLGMSTKAMRSADGSSFKIDGTKMWITNGTTDGQTTGDNFLVYARTGPARQDVSMFLVEKARGKTIDIGSCPSTGCCKGCSLKAEEFKFHFNMVDNRCILCLGLQCGTDSLCTYTDTKTKNECNMIRMLRTVELYKVPEPPETTDCIPAMLHACFANLTLKKPSPSIGSFHAALPPPPVQGMPGFRLGQKIEGKCGMRASMTAELVLDGVEASP